MAKTYWEKLKDPRWQRKRLTIMERDGFACLRCGSKDDTLHVHHGYYEKGIEPWEYEDSTLWTLCGSCHESTQKTTRDIHLQIAKVNPQVISAMLLSVTSFVEASSELSFGLWMLHRLECQGIHAERVNADGTIRVEHSPNYSIEKLTEMIAPNKEALTKAIEWREQCNNRDARP